MKKFYQEFKNFALRGNAIDMAIGIILGSAFGKIVSSIVNDIIMPPIGILLGGMNFTDIKIILQSATEAQPAVTMNIGNFVQVVVDFIIIALSIFIFVKSFNILKRKQEAIPHPPQAPTKTEMLLEEIRDILKKER